MEFAQEPIFQWLSTYAYSPHLIYFLIFALMIASGFGLPLPEEVTLISVGILAYMGAHPEHFPPPYPGAPTINPYEAALFCFLAILTADLLVFFLGRKFGRQLLKTKYFIRFDVLRERVEDFIQRFGSYAIFIFRFTPGLRFPAHLILGASQVSWLRFISIDGFAALISVPTQIILIFHFGEAILSKLSQFKFWLLGIAIVIGLIYWAKTFLGKKIKRSAPMGQKPSQSLRS